MNKHVPNAGGKGFLATDPAAQARKEGIGLSAYFERELGPGSSRTTLYELFEIIKTREAVVDGTPAADYIREERDRR